MFVLLRIVENRAANAFDALGQGRDVALQNTIGFIERLDHAVTQEIHEADQKVSGAHGRVADLKVEQALGRVHARQFRQDVGCDGCCIVSATYFGNSGAESLKLRVCQRPYDFLEDQQDKPSLPT